MQIRLNGELVDAEAYSVSYPNDLLDGVLVDMEEYYIHLSDHVESHRVIQADIPDEIEHFDLSDCDVNYDEPPHSWVVDSVASMVVASAEGLLQS